MSEMYFLKNLSTPDQYAIADIVSEYSQGRSQVKPVEPTELLAKQETLVLLDDDEFAGTISADMPVEYNDKLMTKISTLWVPEKYRRQGHAQRLVTAMTTFAIISQQQPYARVNSSSKWAFQGAGFTSINSPVDIPEKDRIANPDIHRNRSSQVLILGQNVMNQIESEMFANSERPLN